MHRPHRSTIASPAERVALPVIALFAANVALAFGPWFVRLADVGPVAAGFWRIALATPVLFAAAMLLGQNPVRQARGLWIVLTIGGLTFAADLASWHASIHRTVLANATLFGNAATLIFPIYGFVVARAWPSRTQGFALALAAAGAALLMGRSAQLSPQNLVGDLLCLAAGVLYAVYFVTMARARATMAPLAALALSSALGTLPLLVAASALGEQVLPGNWTPLIALAVVSQLIGQGLMIYALGHLSPLIVGIALLIQPIVAGAIGWIAYDERLGWPDVAGAVMVGVALVLVRRGTARTRVEPPGEAAQKDA